MILTVSLSKKGNARGWSVGHWELIISPHQSNQWEWSNNESSFPLSLDSWSVNPREGNIPGNASSNHLGLTLTKYFQSQGVGTDPMLRWMEWRRRIMDWTPDAISNSNAHCAWLSILHSPLAPWCPYCIYGFCLCPCLAWPALSLARSPTHLRCGQQRERWAQITNFNNPLTALTEWISEQMSLNWRDKVPKLFADVWNWECDWCCLSWQKIAKYKSQSP